MTTEEWRNQNSLRFSSPINAISISIPQKFPPLTSTGHWSVFPYALNHRLPNPRSRSHFPAPISQLKVKYSWKTFLNACESFLDGSVSVFDRLRAVPIVEWNTENLQRRRDNRRRHGISVRSPRMPELVNYNHPWVWVGVSISCKYSGRLDMLNAELQCFRLCPMSLEAHLLPMKLIKDVDK